MTDTKKYGQFFTDPIIAEFMVKLSIPQDKKCSVLDPAVGPGILLDKVHLYNDKSNKFAYEIDTKMIKEYKKNCTFKSNLFNEDYLYSTLNKKFDAIICNPPYNKFQEISERDELIKMFENLYNIRLSGYSNYFIYFLIKSMNQLNKNGKCCFIIPYEFLNNGYGKSVKQYLINSKMLSKIIKFNNKMKLFNDAMTTSCIVLLENKKNFGVEFSQVDDINEIINFNGQFVNSKFYNYKELNCEEKWLKYFKFRNNCCEFKNLIKVNKIMVVKRGIATGNNSYFSLNKEKIEEMNLSRNVCVPCVCKSADIKTYKFNQDYYNELYNDNKKVYIFDGTKASNINDYNYIKFGESNNVDKTYLTSHRNPWYSIENKDIAPIWVSVFNRNNIKFVRNEIEVKTLTTFHGVYPRYKDVNYINILFCYLLTPIAQEILFLNKREYSEGLDKFEPNDLNDAYMLNLEILTDEDKKLILQTYENLAEDKINILNKIFEKYIY